MKLSQSAVLELLRLKNEGLSSYRVRKRLRISERRVNQLWAIYRRTGEAPRIGLRLGRPRRPPSARERRLVLQAYGVFRVGATLLEPLLLRQVGVRIPHNRIHGLLVEAGLAQRGEPGVRKRPWVRYERRFSLSAVHMDWHLHADGRWVCPVLDDASRVVLAAIETRSPTTEASLDALTGALRHGPIRAVITDHGSQFTSNRDGTSQFAAFLRAHHIHHILCRIKHPQSNGKLERWFQTYKRHRDAFPTLDKFLHWYNAVKPHLSLNWDTLETPHQAFHRKLRP